jgi:hypothetical protein
MPEPDNVDDPQQFRDEQVERVREWKQRLTKQDVNER